MKKVFLLFVFAFCGLCSFGQDIKKELKTEEDGFKWYRTTLNGFDGAETTDGKCLIPLAKKYVSIQYKSPYLFGLYYSNKPEVIYKTEYYTKEGKEILDNSKYDDTCLFGGKDGVPFGFQQRKTGKMVRAISTAMK